MDEVLSAIATLRISKLYLVDYKERKRVCIHNQITHKI